MEQNDIKTLIESFKGYRNLLTPIQTNLHDFVETYDSMKNDIEKLNTAFDGNVQQNLQKIYQNLTSQAAKATDLSSRIDQFVSMTNKYTTDVNRLATLLETVESRIMAVNALDKKAESQISKLDNILEEKKKTYDIKELQKTIDSYNTNVQKVSEFINKDIADSLSQNHQKLEIIKSGNESLTKRIIDENSSVESLLTTFVSTNELLKKVVEKEDINEEYIFEILDKWAESRKVKTKK